MSKTNHIEARINRLKAQIETNMALLTETYDVKGMNYHNHEHKWWFKTYSRTNRLRKQVELLTIKYN